MEGRERANPRSNGAYGSAGGIALYHPPSEGIVNDDISLDDLDTEAGSVLDDDWVDPLEGIHMRCEDGEFLATKMKREQKDAV